MLSSSPGPSFYTVCRRDKWLLLLLIPFLFYIRAHTHSQSTGDEALELLQRLCANDLDVPVGHIVHTGMLNERGGYENDCSVVRVKKNR